MGAWATADVARDELRAFLNDGLTDRPVKGKKLVGTANGTNTLFFAFDDRIVESTPPSVFVSVNGVDVTFTLDDPIMGQFTLAAAPAIGNEVRARYYVQYFLDSELDEFLRLATGQILESRDVTLINDGLAPAALNFAGYFGFTKQAIRWTQRMSEKYLLEDAPLDDGASQRPNHFRQIAQDYQKAARDQRDSYYMRDSRRHAPAWRMFRPVIPQVGPKT